MMQLQLRRELAQEENIEKKKFALLLLKYL
jgi:hypothetical protein